MGLCARRAMVSIALGFAWPMGSMVGGAQPAVAAQPTGAPAADTSDAETAGIAQPSPFTDDLKDLTYIGFEPLDDAVRVFVRTNEPVKYSLDASHPQRISLVLANCRIVVANNARPLDTSFFDGPVTSIAAHAVDEASPSVHVQIDLREPVHVRAVQHDTELAIHVVPQP